MKSDLFTYEENHDLNWNSDKAVNYGKSELNVVYVNMVISYLCPFVHFDRAVHTKLLP